MQRMITSGGDYAADQWTYRDESGRYFKSYDSIIVKIDHNGQVFLDENDWDYGNVDGKVITIG